MSLLTPYIASEARQIAHLLVDAHVLFDIDAVAANEALGVFPFAFPVLRVGHRPFDVERIAIVETPNPAGLTCGRSALSVC